MCSSGTGTDREAILFLSIEVNSARISGAEQPIRLREKHYPPPEYMLITIPVLYFNDVFSNGATWCHI
jgi:hypothetical protein